MTTTTALPTGRRRTRSHGNSKNANPVTFRLITILVLSLSLPLLFIGGRLVLAAIASYQTQAFLDDWSSKGSEPNPRAWRIARNAAQRAVDLYPGDNGEYLERLGRVLQWQQFRQPFGAPQAEQSRRAALHAFRAATETRPSWPYNWAALAYAKLYLLEFDAEFANALRQAQALGPTRIEVNRTLAEIGLLAWPHLDDGQRKTTLESAIKTVNYSTKEAQTLLAVAMHSGTSEALCNNLDDALKAKRKICH